MYVHTSLHTSWNFLLMFRTDWCDFLCGVNMQIVKTAVCAFESFHHYSYGTSISCLYIRWNEFINLTNNWSPSLFMCSSYVFLLFVRHFLCQRFLFLTQRHLGEFCYWLWFILWSPDLRLQWPLWQRKFSWLWIFSLSLLIYTL